MWNELVGTYQIVAINGTNGAITLPPDGRGNTTGLILIGWFFHTNENSCTCTIVSGGQLGTVVLPLPTMTWERHFNHLLFTPITSITMANLSAGDVAMFEFVRKSNT